MLSNGGEEGARQRIERWLNPDNGGLSWIVSRASRARYGAELITRIQYKSLLSRSARHIPSYQTQEYALPMVKVISYVHSVMESYVLSDRQRAEIDIDYLDSTSLSLSTSLLINFPRPRFAVLPVSLGVELASIGGTVSRT